MTNTEPGAPKLRLCTLSISGLPSKVSASLAVTLTANEAGSARPRPVAILSSLAAGSRAGHRFAAVLALSSCQRVIPLKIANGEATADLCKVAQPACWLEDEVFVEVFRIRSSKAAQLRKDRLFCCSFHTACLMQGAARKVVARHELQEVHPAIGSSVVLDMVLGCDQSPLRAPLMPSATWPAPPAAKLMKTSLALPGADTHLAQVQFSCPARTPPSGSLTASSVAFAPPAWPSQPPSIFGSQDEPAANSCEDTIPSDICSSSCSSSRSPPGGPLPTRSSAPESQPGHLPPSTPFADARLAPGAADAPAHDSQAAAPVAEPSAQQSQQGREGIPGEELAHRRVRVSRSMADLMTPLSRQRSSIEALPRALLAIGGRTFSTPLESAVSLRCRTSLAGHWTAPASPLGSGSSSSSGELECSAPNTPSYPRPEATFDWAFQADRRAALEDLDLDSLSFMGDYPQGRRHMVPPLLLHACTTPMDGARLIKWMSSCWWMSLV